MASRRFSIFLVPYFVPGFPMLENRWNTSFVQPCYWPGFARKCRSAKLLVSQVFYFASGDCQRQFNNTARLKASQSTLHQFYYRQEFARGKKTVFSAAEFDYFCALQIFAICSKRWL
jgi:hypothetical protein